MPEYVFKITQMNFALPSSLQRPKADGDALRERRSLNGREPCAGRAKSDCKLATVVDFRRLGTLSTDKSMATRSR